MGVLWLPPNQRPRPDQTVDWDTWGYPEPYQAWWMTEGGGLRLSCQGSLAQTVAITNADESTVWANRDYGTSITLDGTNNYAEWDALTTNGPASRIYRSLLSGGDVTVVAYCRSTANAKCVWSVSGGTLTYGLMALHSSQVNLRQSASTITKTFTRPTAAAYLAANFSAGRRLIEAHINGVSQGTVAWDGTLFAASYRGLVGATRAGAGTLNCVWGGQIMWVLVLPADLRGRDLLRLQGPIPVRTPTLTFYVPSSPPGSTIPPLAYHYSRLRRAS